MLNSSQICKRMHEEVVSIYSFTYLFWIGKQKGILKAPIKNRGNTLCTQSIQKEPPRQKRRDTKYKNNYQPPSIILIINKVRQRSTIPPQQDSIPFHKRDLIRASCSLRLLSSTPLIYFFPATHTKLNKEGPYFTPSTFCPCLSPSNPKGAHSKNLEIPIEAQRRITTCPTSF